MTSLLADAKPLSVLLLENDAADAELCLLELQRAGFNLRTDFAADIEEFRLKLKVGGYDVILADYNLGRSTGLEAFDYLKEKDLKIPLILVTGALGDEAAVECMKRGISDYVLKQHLARLPVAVQHALEEEALRAERARAEKTLRENERRFRALMENSADGIVLLNDRGKVLFASHAGKRILGYSAGESVGKNVYRLVHPAHRESATARFRELVKTPGLTMCMQLECRAKDGSSRWVECVALNLLQDAAVGGIVVNYRDITDRKKAEVEISRLNESLERRVEERTAQLEAANRELQFEIAERRRAANILRESQERFRILVDGVKDYAIYMLDPTGRVVSWNAGAERIQGYRAEEIVGQHCSCLYAEEEVRAGHPKSDLRVAASAGRQEIECWKARKDGRRFWANIVITALRDPSGKLTGFSKVTRDITERVCAQRALEQLRSQQELILNSAGEGICGLDASACCTFMNPAGARMLGWQPEALNGKPLHQVWRHTKPDGSPCPEEECKILAALKSGALRHEGSAIVWRKDGSSFPVEFVVTPIHSEAGQTSGAVVVFHDATERLALERMKDDFISVTSHELRTPLTAIRGALGLLASGKLCLSPGGCQPMIEAGLSNADRLVRLVNDILDLGRIESGHVKLEKTFCSSADLMRRAANSMAAAAAAQGISLSVTPSSAALFVDSHRIMQVLTNLIDNALKFSSRSSVVRLTAATRGAEVVFRVEDGGRGIPADKLGIIFEKFQQVDASDSRERGGTGLGLAICRSIVTQHGGRIWAESAMGQGSVFSFSLPLGDTTPGCHSEASRDASENPDH
jgi:PAS domain S-box-containing protein